MLISFLSQAQLSPAITSWKINTTGQTVSNGSTNILVDVEAVYYDTSIIYIKTSGVPDYYDFLNNNGNHNPASDLKAVFKIPLKPTKNTGPALSTLGGGQYGLFKDGTLFFNGEDARSYQNLNIWHQLAYHFEGVDFDSTWGHSTPGDQYHHHVLDLAFQDTTKTMVHSQLIGFAFDGYPVYGPFGYKDGNDTTSKIVRMTSSYQTRNITKRTSLPDGTSLTSSNYGPDVSGSFPIGIYREDYTYVSGSGILDDHNGRMTKTREYPNGTYAYYAILDSQMKPAYPYIIGQTYYGAAAKGNFGPTGGQNTIPASALKYTGISSMENESQMDLSFYPNPASDRIQFTLPKDGAEYGVSILDLSGRKVLNILVTGAQAIDISTLHSGMYILQVNEANSTSQWIGKLVKE